MLKSNGSDFSSERHKNHLMRLTEKKQSDGYGNYNVFYL